jgi:hypothetical protein
MTPALTLTSGTLTSGTSTAVTSTIWPTWNQQYTSTTGGITTGTTVCGGAGAVSNSVIVVHADGEIVKGWKSWNSTYVERTTATGTSGTTTLVVDPWVVWVQLADGTITGTLPSIQPRISEEEYQARRREEERRENEWRQQRAIEAREREAAKARAQVLLREHLTEEQKAELADKRFFSLSVIDGKSGERRHYRIHQGRAGNVEQVNESGNRIKGFCIHPSIDCPDEDTMLAQKLWLETREDEFRRVANHR